MFGLKPSSSEGVKSVDKISTLCFMSILYCTTSQKMVIVLFTFWYTT